MFSVGDMLNRLKRFRTRHQTAAHFYFAKVDVQGAFDTIPQDAVIKLMDTIPREDCYKISKHVEVTLREAYSAANLSAHDGLKLNKKWQFTAAAARDSVPFPEALNFGPAAVPATPSSSLRDFRSGMKSGICCR